MTLKMNVMKREILYPYIKRSGYSFGSRCRSGRHLSSSSSIKTTTVKAQLPTAKPEKKIPLGGTPICPTSYGQPTHLTHPHRQLEGEIVPGLRAEEFRARRYRLMESIGSYSFRNDLNPKSHLVVIPSSQKKYMTEKIPYFFRQNTDFLYLSGCMEPDSVLVLTTNVPNDHESNLFLRGKDPNSELWDGPRTGVDQAPSLFGVDRAFPLNEFENFLSSFVKSNCTLMLWYDFLHDINPNIHRIMRDCLTNTVNKIWESPRPFIQRLRLYKSPAEQKLMKMSCEIACNAIADTIRFSAPGNNEAELFAHVDYKCRMGGAEYLAYPPVVAGGTRANIIHYINNDQVVHDGEMVLMDAGCEYHSYSSDITRTWPISGKFTPAQRNLYDAVHSVQLDLIRLCSTFPTLDTLFHNMCKLLGVQLQQHGIFNSKRLKDEDDLSRAAYTFCPHHCSHYLGMDVHDTALIPRSIPVEPGMIITIEPGIYVNPNNKLANPEYHGLGVRIEDDILITDSGPVVLTDRCPKHPDDIEKLKSDNPIQET